MGRNELRPGARRHGNKKRLDDEKEKLSTGSAGCPDLALHLRASRYSRLLTHDELQKEGDRVRGVVLESIAEVGGGRMPYLKSRCRDGDRHSRPGTARTRIRTMMTGRS